MADKRKLASLAFCLALLCGSVAAAERVDRTGSRLGTDATGRVVVRFSEPDEIKRVLKLLESGRTEAALALAEDYLDSLASTISVGGSSMVMDRYSALNAVCAVLTKAGRLDEAATACSDAIALLPRRWTAINNRGTVYFAQGRYEDALVDYRRALEVAPRRDGPAATIEHNIRLTVDRLDAQN